MIDETIPDNNCYFQKYTKENKFRIEEKGGLFSLHYGINMAIQTWGGTAQNFSW